MEKTFLEAEWRKLAMVNYEFDPKLLIPFLPHKTELDLWNHTCFVSLVGFMFLNTRLLGFKIPFHSNFEEVNLRFYVRYKEHNNWKRGVVFIKEIVPKHALSFIANLVYGENYETMPMKHDWQMENNRQIVEYQWKKAAKWHSIKVQTEQDLYEIDNDSEAAFITDHYWGYTKINDKKTSEYAVEHPKWQVYKTLDYKINVNFGEIYGHAFNHLETTIPKSVFLAEGSNIEVKHGKKI